MTTTKTKNPTWIASNQKLVGFSDSVTKIAAQFATPTEAWDNWPSAAYMVVILRKAGAETEKLIRCTEELVRSVLRYCHEELPEYQSDLERILEAALVLEREKTMEAFAALNNAHCDLRDLSRRRLPSAIKARESLLTFSNAIRQHSGCCIASRRESADEICRRHLTQAVLFADAAVYWAAGGPPMFEKPESLVQAQKAQADIVRKHFPESPFTDSRE